MSHRTSVSLNVKHLTRIEGHGNIVVDATNGHIKECRWEIPEAPRFFEAMVRGRTWQELHHITSRICGICSISHTLASVKATEAALGLEISGQTAALRKLAKHAESLQSHVLHLGYLVLPDLMGVGSVIPLAKSHPEEVRTVIRLHRLGNEMSQVICARTTHPQRIVPGGFTRLPAPEELQTLKDRLQQAVGDLQAVADLVKSVAGAFPAFERQTEYIALADDSEYPFCEGRIGRRGPTRDPVPRLRVRRERALRQRQLRHPHESEPRQHAAGHGVSAAGPSRTERR